MSMVCGLDLHRQQITFDAMDTMSGEVWRGRVWQPDRDRVRRWLRDDVARRADGQPVAMAVEGCTGWRYVVEEIEAAGFEAHVAEPADTQAARGRKHRAKTDRSDARLLRELLQRGELPESWIPPPIVLEWRERVRLYKSLVDQRLVWIQRIHAELFQHGVAVPESAIRSAQTRAWSGQQRRRADRSGPPAAPGRVHDDRRHRRRSVAVEGAADPVRDASAGLSGAGRQPLRDRRAAGGGHLVRVRRLSTVHAFGSSGAPHRLDVKVDSSDLRRAGGYLTRQGPATLRWALFEAAHNASRSASPDHGYYTTVKDRHDGKLAAISVARKFARRCYHLLRNMDPDVVYAVAA